MEIAEYLVRRDDFFKAMISVALQKAGVDAIKATNIANDAVAGNAEQWSGITITTESELAARDQSLNTRVFTGLRHGGYGLGESQDYHLAALMADEALAYAQYKWDTWEKFVPFPLVNIEPNGSPASHRLTTETSTTARRQIDATVRDKVGDDLDI